MIELGTAKGSSQPFVAQAKISGIQNFLQTQTTCHSGHKQRWADVSERQDKQDLVASNPPTLVKQVSSG